MSKHRTQNIAELKETFRSYAKLEDNWDYEGSITPLSTPIENAITFLENIPPDVPLPYPEAGRDGDVGIYWPKLRAKNFAQVVFAVDDTFTYLAIIKNEAGDETIFGGEDLPVCGSWPADLLEVLRSRK